MTEVFRIWISVLSLIIFAAVGCDNGTDNNDPPPADTIDTTLTFDTLQAVDTAPALDLPKGWTGKKDLHKEEE